MRCDRLNMLQPQRSRECMPCLARPLCTALPDAFLAEMTVLTLSLTQLFFTG